MAILKDHIRFVARNSSVFVPIVIFVAALFLSGGAAEAQQTRTWDGGGDGISWSDPNNWSNNTAPREADTARISSVVTILLNQAAEVRNLEIEAGATILMDNNLMVGRDITVTDNNGQTATLSGSGKLIMRFRSDSEIMCEDPNDILKVDSFELNSLVSPTKTLILIGNSQVNVVNSFVWDTCDDFTIKTGSTFTVPNMVIPVGSILNAETCTINVAGTFTENGTFNEASGGGNSTVQFTGADATVTLGKTPTVFMNLTVASGAIFTPSVDVTVSNNFTCNGTLTPGSTSFLMTATDGTATLSGTGTVVFYNLQLFNAAATYTISTSFSVSGTYWMRSATAVNANANTITINGGTWDNDIGAAAFNEGTSTVVFSGGSPLLPDIAETFCNIKIDSTVSSAARANYTVSGNWTNERSTFVSGAYTVTFSGAGCNLLGTAPLTLGTATVSGTLTLDSGDDLAVNVFAVNAGSTLTLSGNCYLRIGTSSTISGNFNSSGSTPTITDGLGNNYSWTFSSANTINVTRLDCYNLDANGMRFTAKPASLTFDGVNLDHTMSAQANTTYLKLLFDPAGAAYILNNCTFGLYCTYNVETANTWDLVGETLTIRGFTGGKGGGTYENDRGLGPETDADPDNTASVRWPSKTWNGSASNSWTNGNNWTPVGQPAASDKVTIPYIDGVLVPNAPSLNTNTTIAALQLLSGAQYTTDGAGRQLTINGSLVVTEDTGNGVASFNHTVAAGGFLTVLGNVINSGSMTISAPTCTVSGFVENMNSFVATVTTFTVSGKVTNSSIFTPGAITVGGSWINSGTYNCGTSTVTLNATSGELTTGGSSFYNLVISNAKVYQSTDQLFVSNNLTVNGTLKLYTSVSVTGVFSNAGGKIQFNGTVAQSAPAWSYNNLTISNATVPVTLDGNITVGSALTVDSGAGIQFGSRTVTLNGSLVNNGTITTGTSTVVFGGAPSSISGSTSTEFYNFQITGTLNLAANVLIKNAWTNNGTFNNTNSTVSFTGAGCSINGIATQPFYNLTISVGAVLVSNCATVRVAGAWANDGSFTPGTVGVEFNGTNATLGDSLAATTFYNVTVISGKFTMDASDYITVSNQFKVNNGTQFYMQNASTLRLGTAAVIEGYMNVSGSVPLITDTGSKYAFTVQNGGQLFITELDFKNPDNNGLTIASTAAVVQNIGGIGFSKTDFSEQGTYLQMLITNVAEMPYRISFCSFDLYCQYNIATNAALGAGTYAVEMVGFGGAKGAENFENDRGLGVVANGTIRWTQKLWDAGDNSTRWDRQNNFNPDTVPIATDRVIIPDESTLANQISPLINTDTTIASLIIEDGGNLGSSGNARTLNICGSLNIEPDTGAGAPGNISWGTAGSTTTYLTVGGDVSNAGDFILNNIATGRVEVQGNFLNTGTFTNNIAAPDQVPISIFGSMDNSGIMTPGTISVYGSWSNTWQFNCGTGTITFRGVNKTISSGNGSFYNLVIPTDASYSSLDNLTITNALTVNGLLKVKRGISIPASFTYSGGTIEFSGTIPQSIPAKTYNNVIIDNQSYAVTLDGNITVYGNLTINAGASLSPGNSTITLYGNLVNNGTFNADSSTIVFANAFCSVQGTMPASFNNLTINNGASLTINNTGMLIRVGGNWLDNNATTAGLVSNNSTVSFFGAASVINGAIVEVFQNLSIENTCTLSVGAIGQIKVKGTFTNNGLFAPGTTTVNFTGTDSQIAGSNTTFYILRCDGVLTVSTGDIVNATNQVYIATTGKLKMTGTGLVKAVAVVVDGTLETSETPTLTSYGSSFSFTVNNAAAVLNVNGLNITNPDDNGLRVVSASSISLDNITFTNVDNLQTGYYIRLEMAGIPASRYVFSGCSFDMNCQYNVYVPASAANSALSMPAAGGEKGSENYEDEGGAGYVAGGKILWPLREWDAGAATNNWNDGTNWDPDGVPQNGEKVKIPSPSVKEYDPLEYPRLNCNVNIGSLIIEDGAKLETTGDNRQLVITGSLTVEANAGEGSDGVLNFTSAGTTSKLDIQRNLTNAGSFSVSNATIFTIGANLANTGTFTNSSSNFSVSGNITNSNTITPGSCSLSGSFANSGAFAAGTGTVTFKGTNCSITSGSAVFYNATFNSGSSYTASDAFSVSAALSLQGSLALNGTLSMGTSFSSTSGLIDFAGTVAQSIPQPPGGASYFNLTVSNASGGAALSGNIAVAGNLYISPGATFDGQSYSMTLTGNWTNDGIFTPGTSTLLVNGTPTTIAGLSNTTFYNVTISNTKTLIVGSIGQIGVKGIWTNNGTYSPSTATVVFKGTPSSISGSVVTQFYNMTVDTGAVLDLTVVGGQVNIQNNFTNNGTFSPGDDTVEFIGTNCSLFGNPISTYRFTVSGKLTLDSGDDLTGTNLITISGTLVMTDTCYLRVGTAVSVTGLVQTSGVTPVITDTGSKYSFSVSGGGRVLINGLMFQNCNNSGLNIQSTAGTDIDIDNCTFSDSDGVPLGTFLTLGYAAIAAYKYSFLGCTFNQGALYNISTTAGASDTAVTMVGDGGPLTGETYENDKGVGTIASGGSILWRVIRWEGDVSTSWNTSGNWSTNSVPTTSDKVIIQSPNERGVGTTNEPTLDINTTIASLLMYDGSVLSTSGTTRIFNVTGSIYIETNSGYGSSAQIDFTASAAGSKLQSGSIQNNGSMTVAAETLFVTTSLSNTGSFTATSTTFTVSGDLSNSNAMSVGSMSIGGSFANTGAFNPNAGTVSFTGATGTITSTGSSFNNLSIANGSIYTALDGLSVAGSFVLPGYLKVLKGLTFGTSFTEAGGTVEFNGTINQNVPPETYNVVKITNSTGNVVTNGPFTAVDLLIGANANLAGGTYTHTITQKWTNNGIYQPETSTVVFSGASCSIEGTSTTSFNNITNSNSLTVNITEVKVQGVFNNTGTFVAVNSTVNFTGATSQITGNAGTVFNIIKIDTGATLSDATNDIRVSNQWIQNGAFTPGSTIVRFTGTGCNMSGASAITFYRLYVVGKLTLDSSDIVVVSNQFYVLNTGTFYLTQTSTLKLGGAAIVEGLFNASGNTPTVTYDGATRYSFSVRNSGVFTANGLNFYYPDANGLYIETTAGAGFDIDAVNFRKPGDAVEAGLYIRIDKIVASSSYSFAGCSFDQWCQYNIQTFNGSIAAGMVVTMFGYSGDKGLGIYENDNQQGPETDGDPENTGSVRWPAAKWNGSISSAWSNSANWSPAAVPTSSQRVVIPSPSEFTGAQIQPSLDISTTVAALEIQDGAILTSSAVGTQLTISGQLSISENTGEGVGQFDFSSTGAASMLWVKGNLLNKGTLAVSNAATFKVDGSLTNSGSFVNSTVLTLLGGLTNTGSLTPYNATISGSWSNSGTVAPGTGTITFAGSTGTIASGGQAFNSVKINSSCSYTASDAISVVGTLTLPGTLGVKTTVTFGSAFVSTGGAVEFSGAIVQTIPTAPSAYNNLTVSNSTATVSIGASIQMSGTLTISVGAVLDSSSYTLTIGGDFINNGTFQKGTSTVAFNGAPSYVNGSVITEFNNVTVNSSKSLRVGAVGTISVYGNWTSAGSFISDTSIVKFTGPTCVIGGTASTEFNNLTVNSGAVLSVDGTLAQFKLKGAFTNDGTFQEGSSTVYFTGTAGGIAGTNTLNFYNLQCDGTLNMDSGDDITVINQLKVSASGTLSLAGNCFVRLGTATTLGALVVEGQLSTSGSTPTIRDMGALFSFTVQNGGRIVLNGLNLVNPNVDGLNILATANSGFDIDSVSFSSDSVLANRTYLKINLASCSSSFSNMSFDSNCTYNVFTSSTVEAQVFVVCTGYSGSKGDGSYENDGNRGAYTVGDPDNSGTIRWYRKMWTGAISESWANVNNWNPVGTPAIADKVVIPTGVPRYPILDMDTTIAALQIQDGASFTSSAVDRKLTVTALISLDADGGSAGVPTFTFTSGGIGSLTINGSLVVGTGSSAVITGTTMALTSDLSTSGSVSLSSITSSIGGNVTVSGAGALTIGSNLSVGGNWSNAATATFAPGTNTVTFNSAAGTIASGGDAFYRISIPGTASYTATDSLSTSDNMTVNGVLKVKTSFAVGGVFSNTNGTIEYNGTVDQTAAALAYNILVDSNTGGVVYAGGDFTATNVTVQTNATFNASGRTITVAGTLTNNGTFTPAGSTVVFDGSPAVLVGSSVTQFTNLTIPNTKSLSLSGITSLKVSGSWTNNGGSFTSGSSTVTFNGGPATIAGTSSTQFNNLIIFSGTSLSESVTGNQIDVKATWTNDGTFNEGDSEVRFTTVNGAIAGSAVTFNNLTVTGTGRLTIDGTDDVTVGSALTVNSGGALSLKATSNLRLGKAASSGALTVNGSFDTDDALGMPVVTCVNTGFKYSMQFNTSGNVDINGLSVKNVNDAGLVIADAVVDPSFDMDRVTFTDDVAAASGVYIAFNDLTISGLDFTSCSFDANCANNIAAAVGAQNPAITFSGYGGAKGGGLYETDPQNAADPDISGSIRWPKRIWEGDVSSAWNNPANWDGNLALPGTFSRVEVPAAGVTNEPLISSNIEIGSLVINTGRTLGINPGSNDVSITVHGNVDVTSSTFVYSSGGNAAKTITIEGGLNITGTGGFSAGSSAGSLSVAVSSNLTVDPAASVTFGQANVRPDAMSIGGNVSNSGSIIMMDNKTMNVTGNYTNAVGGVLSMPNTDADDATGAIVDIAGNFTNTGGTVTFGDFTDELRIAGTIGSWGTISGTGTVVVDNQVADPVSIPTGTFYNLKVNGGTRTYQLAAGLTVKNVLTVMSGVLSLNGQALTIGDTGGPTAGTLLVSGGTLTMQTGSSITFTDASSFSVASGASFVATAGTLASTNSATNWFDMTLGGTVNITGLDIFNVDTGAKGVNVTATAVLTSMSNISFNNAIDGGSHLTVEHPGPVAITLTGCYFDSSYGVGTCVSVTDTIPADGNPVCVILEYRDALTNGDGAGPGTEAVSSSYVYWVYTANSGIKGAVQGYPTVAYDLDTFARYSTYVASRNVNAANDDKIYVLDGNGDLVGYSYAVLEADGDLVGTPWWDTEVDTGDADNDGNVAEKLHTLYIGTSKGKMLKVIDTGAAMNLAIGPNWGGGLDVSPTTINPVTSPVITDADNIYFGGYRDDGNPYMFAYTKSTKAALTNFPISIGKQILTAPSSYDNAGVTYLFVGTNIAGGKALIERINVDSGAVDASYDGVGSDTANGGFKSPTILYSYLYLTDDGSANANKGWLHSMSPFGAFNDESVGYPWPGPGSVYVNKPGPILVAPWDDDTFGTVGLVLMGDTAGRFFAVPITDPQTDFVLKGGFDLQLEAAAAVTSCPLSFFDGGYAYVANSNGKIFVIDVNGKAFVQNPDYLTDYYYYMGKNISISYLSYDYEVDKILVGTSNGNVYYVDLVP